MVGDHESNNEDDDVESTPDEIETEGGITFGLAPLEFGATDDSDTSDDDADNDADNDDAGDNSGSDDEPEPAYGTAGELVHIKLSPSRSIPDIFTYAPESCLFVEKQCDDIDSFTNCTDRNTFELFNYQKNSCDQ